MFSWLGGVAVCETEYLNCFLIVPNLRLAHEIIRHGQQIAVFELNRIVRVITVCVTDWEVLQFARQNVLIVF